MDSKEILGRCTWYIFHKTLNDITTQENIEQFKIFWNSFITIYPCKECREHIIKLMNDSYKNKLENCDTKEKLIQWGINIHNEVNKKLNKPLFPYKLQSRQIQHKNNNIYIKNKFSRRNKMSKYRQNQLHMRYMLATSYISRNTTSCSSCG